jgi:hypothetical protein
VRRKSQRRVEEEDRNIPTMSCSLFVDREKEISEKR